VNDGIHAPDGVDLVRIAPRFGGTAQIADHDADAEVVI
jgi:hypothetical protein